MAPVIELDKVCKTFDERAVLDNLSLSIQSGESVVIIGQSGTGKSVLLKHILRLMSPDKGRVLFEGEDIATMPTATIADVRRRFGMLFQSAALFDSLTVAENVGLGIVESRMFPAEEVSDRIAAKLELVGLASAADRYPSELSGGMRKRVGMARAIAHDPDIILYDEPTTGLDPITSDMINDLIVTLNEHLHVTSVTVTHDLTTVRKVASRVVMLNAGSVEFDGTPEDLKTTENEAVQQFIHGRARGPLQVG